MRTPCSHVHFATLSSSVVQQSSERYAAVINDIVGMRAHRRHADLCERVCIFSQILDAVMFSTHGQEETTQNLPFSPLSCSSGLMWVMHYLQCFIKRCSSASLAENMPSMSTSVHTLELSFTFSPVLNLPILLQPCRYCDALSPWQLTTEEHSVSHTLVSVCVTVGVC